MAVYYNEHDPYAAEWLRNLISAGLIAPGDVDERDIQEVKADGIKHYKQVHLFAGIGGWSYALRLAGWPDDRPVWTGSCPCQPFSTAGKRKGTRDKRHLWPHMYRLVRECRPPKIGGEQVASAIGHGWLDGVFADLEAEGYACGAIVLGAHSIGAPHIRQRLWWLADAGFSAGERDAGELPAPQAGVDRTRQQDGRCHQRSANVGDSQPGGLAEAGRMGESILPGPQGHAGHGDDGGEPGRVAAQAVGSTAPAGAWADAILIPCADGKARRISAEPGDEPLAHGLPRSVGPGSTKEQRMELMAAKANRVGRLKGYGNAIVPQVAAEFIRAWMDA